MKFNEVEINFPCQGGNIGKVNFPRYKKRRLYDKAVKEEKGKMPKSSKKEARDKSIKFLQRMGQFPLGELKKAVRKKPRKFWKGRA